MNTPLKSNAVELFDRVRILDTCELVQFRGREGTVAFLGASGVNVVVEDMEEHIPLKWSEFKLLSWGDFGEEE